MTHLRRLGWWDILTKNCDTNISRCAANPTLLATSPLLFIILPPPFSRATSRPRNPIIRNGRWLNRLKLQIHSLRPNILFIWRLFGAQTLNLLLRGWFEVDGRAVIWVLLWGAVCLVFKSNHSNATFLLPIIQLLGRRITKKLSSSQYILLRLVRNILEYPLFYRERIIFAIRRVLSDVVWSVSQLLGRGGRQAQEVIGAVGVHGHLVNNPIDSDPRCLQNQAILIVIYRLPRLILRKWASVFYG